MHAEVRFIRQSQKVVARAAAVSHSIRGDLANLEPRIFAAWDWFDLESIPAPLFPPSYHLLTAYESVINKTLNIPPADPAMIARRYLVSAS
jgi:hypothetical protein